MTAHPQIDNRTARAIFLDRHGLAGEPTGPGKGPDLQRVIDALGFVQIDSINTVARAHHMILHARRPAYRPRNLDLLHDRFGNGRPSRAEVGRYWSQGHMLADRRPDDWA